MMLIISLLVAASGWFWLWFMIKRPDKWGLMVDKENAFWVRLGIAPVAFTERVKRFEKGLGQKVLICVAAILWSLLFIFFLVHK